MVKNMSLLSRISISATNKRRISNKAAFAFVFYMVLPTFAILMIMSAYPELNTDRLWGILTRIIPISIILILISQFQVRYEKGTKGRFILNEIYVIMVVVWIFALLGGEPVIYQTWEEYSFSLHIWNYIALILFVTIMNIIYYAMEYEAFSKDESQEVQSVDIDLPTEDGNQPKGVIITTIPLE
jgi:hypothetical protein